MEAHDAVVRHAGGRRPGDAVVLAGLGDPAFPLPAAEPDLLLSAELVVPLPLDVQHPVHDLLRLVELRPALFRAPDALPILGPALAPKPPRLLASRAAASEG